jgi:hypothetical protein
LLSTFELGVPKSFYNNLSTLHYLSSLCFTESIFSPSHPGCSGASWSFLAIGLQTSPSGAANLVAVPISGAGNLVRDPISSLVGALNPGREYFIWLSRHSVFFQPNR